MTQQFGLCGNNRNMSVIFSIVETSEPLLHDNLDKKKDKSILNKKSKYYSTSILTRLILIRFVVKYNVGHIDISLNGVITIII